MLDVAATLYPARLQQLKMDLVSDSTCSSDPDVTDADIFVSDIMICAGYNDNFATICNVSTTFLYTDEGRFLDQKCEDFLAQLKICNPQWL